MPQHWDLDKGSGHIHKSKNSKSHQSPGGLEEASTHNQNNEYFEVTYERQASKSGVQQKKENKKEISIGTLLPGRQISQCLCRSLQFHTQTSTGTPLGRMDFPVVTIPQDCPAPSACAKCSQWAVKQLQGSSSSVAAFQTGIQQNFCTCVILHIWVLNPLGGGWHTHLSSIRTEMLSCSNSESTWEGQLMFLAANFDNFHLWAMNRNNKNLTFIQFPTTEIRWKCAHGIFCFWYWKPR